MTRRRRWRWMGGLMAAAWLALVLHAEAARAGGFERTGKVASDFVEGTFDVVILRPLTGTALLVGSVFFVASAPFSTPEGWIRTGSFVEGVRPAWSAFVYAPYEYMVVRELGDF